MEPGNKAHKRKGRPKPTDGSAVDERPVGDEPTRDVPASLEAHANRLSPAVNEIEGSGGEPVNGHDRSKLLRSTQIEARLDQIQESVDQIPVKMRNLSRDIKAITKSVSDSRLSELLSRLVQFADILDGLVEKGPDTSETAGALAHDTHTALRTQMWQILRLSGVTETTPKQGAPFDPMHHRATARVSTRSAERDQTIHEVHRTGFESGDYILRYPEVTVYTFDPTSKKPRSKGKGRKRSDS